MIRNKSFAVTAHATGATVAKLAASAVIGACAFAAPAQAATLNFNNAAGLAFHGDQYQESGYNLGFYSNVTGATTDDYVGAFLDGADPTSCPGGACPVNNPTTYYGATNDSYIDLFALNPLLRFQVKEFDASFLGGTAALTGYPTVSGLLRIQGILSNGASVTETYQLGGPNANGFNFGHFNTTAAFGNQLFVEALFYGFVCNTAGSCSAFNSDRAQFGLDNLRLVEVPEPASLALFGLGLVGLTAAARRRKA